MKKRVVRWGVVQQLCVEADTDEALNAALTIALSYYYASHFRTGVDDLGVPCLELGRHGSPFLTPIVEPAELVTAVKNWLDDVQYPKEPVGFDGSVKKGWRVEGGDDGCIKVTPALIYYSK